MNNFFQNGLSKKILIVISFVIVTLILWNTYDFSKKIKRNERVKMEVLAKAYDRFGTENMNQDYSLEAKIIESNNTIPMIVTDEKGNILMTRNLDPVKASKKGYLEEQLATMKKENAPIIINYLKEKEYIIYYKDSELLYRLQYYPLTLLLILVLFSGIIYMVFRANKTAVQNKLWTGMAKETAHQIGTPLSSMLGWIELLKLEDKAPEIVSELEKDVARLNIIADRFSKIGSVPTLSVHDIGGIIDDTVTYFKSRSSKNLDILIKKPEVALKANLNEQLFTWVLENLIKNAIDAMSGKGRLVVAVELTDKLIKVIVTDTGKGFSRSMYKKIFTPGFTTKKRGWGLGLSLSKRIIEDYHVGKIFVKKSEPNVGTSIEIQLKKL